MFNFLATIRHLIGKNTKFKRLKCITPLHLQNRWKGQVLRILSLILVVSVLSPTAYGMGQEYKVYSRYAQQQYLSSEHKMPWTIRFTGGEDLLSPKRPSADVGIRFDDAVGLEDKSKPILRLQKFIKAERKSYQLTATDLHFLHENDYEKNDMTPFPFNETIRSEKETNGTHGRHKRAVILTDKNLSMWRRRRKTPDHESEGTFVISNIGRVTPQYYEGTKATDINCQRIGGKTLVFALETVDDENKLKIHQLNDKYLTQRFLMSANAPEAVSVEVFKINDQLFAFTTVKHGPKAVESQNTINTGSILYRVNLFNNSLDKTQTIHMPFAQSSAFWSGMGEEANDNFLVIAPSKALTATGTTYKVMVPCYRWQGGYFDYVSQFPAMNPQSIEHFNMLSHDYLAVANYQNDAGSNSIQSEIFKYHHNDRRFVSFQRIQTYGAKDIKHFTFETADGSRKEHFIAIANSCIKDEDGKLQFWVQSPIMKYGQKRFLPFKSFYAYGAEQFLPVKDNDKFFLALADFHGIRMFQYNGWSFVETFSVKYETTQSSPFSLRLRQLQHNGLSYITLASNTEGIQNGMFAVDYETRNDHRKLISSVEAWCTGASRLMDATNLMEVENRISQAPKVTDDKVNVKGKVTFKKGIRVGDLRTRALHMGRTRSLGHHEFDTLSKLGKKYSELTRRVNDIQSKLDNVVWVDKDQDVEGPVLFEAMSYKNPRLDIENLKVDRFGGTNVPEHLDNVVMLNQPQNLKGITTRTVVTNDFSTNSINDQPLRDYAVRNPTATQVFSGKNEFLSEVRVKERIKVKHSFAGLSFSRPNFLLSWGNQTFADTTMNLKRTEVKNLYTRELNGHDVFFHFLDAVSLTGGTITGEKHFEQIKAKNLKVTSLNNVDINRLFENAIYTDSRLSLQTFITPKHFESVEVNELHPGNREINGELDLSKNFINVERGEYKLKNLKISGDAKVDDLTVRKKLNEIKVEDGRMDILLKNSTHPQHIKTKKVKAIKFSKDVVAQERVDGIELHRWSEINEVVLENNVIEGMLNLPGNMDAEDNHVTVTKAFHLGEKDVLNLFRKSARLDSSQLPGHCALELKALKVDGNSDVHGLISNEVKPSQWVINSEHQVATISAEKKFTGPVHLEKDAKAGTLFGTEDKKENFLQVFPNLLLDGPDQTIKHSFTFTKNFHADRASCPNTRLDGIEFQDILFKKGDQTVKVKSIFQQPVVATGDTTVIDKVAVRFVNQINIRNQIKDTLRTRNRDGTQTVRAHYTFKEVLAKDAVVKEEFAHSDVHSIFGGIVKNGDPVKLTKTHLSFAKGADVDHLDYIGHLNEIPSSEWSHAWLLTRTDQEIDTKVEFAGPVTATNIHAPTVNNVNMKELSEDILRIDKDENVPGTMVFSEAADISHGVHMPNGAKINGLDFRKDVLLKSHPHLQTVSGSNNFKNGMNIKGSLSVKEMRDFDLSNFAKLHHSSSDGVDARSGKGPVSLVINGNAKLKSEPEIKSRINQHQWQHILESFWFRDQDTVLQHPVTFSSLELEKGGNIGNTDTLNNINLNDFEKNYASKSRENVWKGLITLQNVQKASQIQAPTLTLENDGLFNGENMEGFYNSVLRYSGDQTIRGNFKTQNLKTNQLDTARNGALNSVNAKDFMTISGQNVLRSHKNFHNIKADKLFLSPNTVIDGVDIGNWDKHAVRKEGDLHQNQEIQGPVHFSNLRAIGKVKVDGLVDGVHYNKKNLLTTDQDQEIFGTVTIKEVKGPGHTSALKTPAGVQIEGRLNGINVKDVMSKMVFTNQNENTPIVVRGPVTFNAPVYMKQIKTEALLQGQNVSALLNNFKRVYDQVFSDSFVARKAYEKLLDVARRMHHVSKRKATFLDHYVLTQTMQVRSTYVKVLRKLKYPAIAMGFKKSQLITTENWWAYNAPLDYYQLQVGNRVQLEGNVVDVAELEHEKGNLFAFAVNNESKDRPAQAALEVMNSNQNFELNKSPDKMSKTFILKTVEEGTANVRPAISQVIYDHSFNSIRSFTVSRNNGKSSCLIATTGKIQATENAASIYCLDKEAGFLSKVQDLALDSPSLTTVVPVWNTTMVGVLTRSGENHPEGLLEFWRGIDKHGVLKFVKHSCLPVFNVISIDSISTRNGKIFLAIASAALSRSDYQGSVFLYRYSLVANKFKKMQTIDIEHPKDVKLQWLKSSNEHVAYVLSDAVTNNVHVYKYKGLAGWNLVHKFTSEKGKSLQVTDFTVDKQYGAQLLVTSLSETRIYSAQFKGGSTALEEVVETATTMMDDSIAVDVDNL